jgi:hypothetical protein
LDHERQLLDLRALDPRALELLVHDQPALVEPVRDQLPLVPQVFAQLVREVAEPVLQAELIDQRVVLIAH